MSDQHVGNPMKEGTQHGAKLAMELAGLALVGLQHLTKVRQAQEEARLAQDRQDAELRQTELRATHARDRLAWAPALERELATARTGEVAAAWTAAQPWTAHDPAAAEASRRAEARLAELHPDLMAHYDAHRMAGAEPNAAMVDAHRDLARPAWEPFLPPLPFRGVEGAVVRPTQVGTAETLQAWNATRLWAPQDAEAAEAMTSVEAHLRFRQPAAMAMYDDRRAMGDDPEQAMAHSARLFVADPWVPDVPTQTPALDPGAANAARTLGNEQRQVSVLDLGTPDLVATPRLDEHTEGVKMGSHFEELADTAGARAASLSSLSYPQPIHAAMAASHAAHTTTAPGPAHSPAPTEQAARARGR